MISGFHHVAMRVKDFDATVKFYTEILGFKKSTAWGENDNRAIMLDTGAGDYLEVFAGGSSELNPEGAFIHLAFRTDNCDEAIEKVRAAGMEITDEPKDVLLGSIDPTPIRIAFFNGPDGEVIEFFQNK